MLQSMYWSELHSSEGLAGSGESVNTSKLSHVAIGWPSLPYHIGFSIRGIATGFPQVSDPRKREEAGSQNAFYDLVSEVTHCRFCFYSIHDK